MADTVHASAPLQAYDVVVLAGGTGERLGGVDKALLRRDGRTLLDRLVDVVADARRTVVAGPERPTQQPVIWTREDPPCGGPGSGVLAGLRLLVDGTEDHAPVLVVAVDMAYVSPRTVARLRAAPEEASTHESGSDGSVLIGHDGRRQLCLLLRAGAVQRLLDAYAGSAEGLPVHRLIGDLDLAHVPADADEDRDIDTPADLARLDAAPSAADPD